MPRLSGITTKDSEMAAPPGMRPKAKWDWFGIFFGFCALTAFGVLGVLIWGFVRFVLWFTHG